MERGGEVWLWPKPADTVAAHVEDGRAVRGLGQLAAVDPPKLDQRLDHDGCRTRVVAACAYVLRHAVALQVQQPAYGIVSAAGAVARRELDVRSGECEQTVEVALPEGLFPRVHSGDCGGRVGAELDMGGV